jgi:hypothetical protein
MRRALLVLSVSGLLITACGDDSAVPAQAQAAVTSPAAPNTTSSAEPSPVATEPGITDPGAPETVAVAVAPEALQFTAPMVGGGDIDFTQYAGQTVAMWFWAPT